MNTAKINNEVNLTYPESYQIMGEEELQRYFGKAENRWGVYDAERHVILSVSWSKAGFKTLFSDAETMLIGVEAKFKRSLINYRRTDARKTKIARKKGYAIRFQYRANNTNMYYLSDLRAVKCKGKYYAFQYICRRINDEECHPDFDAMMESVTIG